MRALVLVSGRGSNLRAILQARDAGECDVDVVGVLSDRESAAALELARERGIACATVRPRDHATRETWDEALADAAAAFTPDIVVLAGFMRILGASSVARFAGRIINVHPSLLPAFPGKDGPAMALEAGVAISGCTVHVVDRGVDTGPVLAQAAVPVLQGDDRDALHARIQAQEHRLLPRVLCAIARGHIVLGDAPRHDAGPQASPPSALHWPQWKD